MTHDRKGWAIPSALAQCELEGFGWTWSSSGVSDCAFPISLNVFGIVAVVLDSLKPRHHGKVPYPRRGIATVYKSTLGSNITFKTNLDLTHTSFEVVQASITLQHNTLHFFCLYRPPPSRRNNFTDSMFIEQLPDLLDYVNSLPGFVCLVGDMNIHFDNPFQSLTKQTLSTLSLYSLVQVISKPTHCCGHTVSSWGQPREGCSVLRALRRNST